MRRKRLSFCSSESRSLEERDEKGSEHRTEAPLQATSTFRPFSPSLSLSATAVLRSLFSYSVGAPSA
jgi:hypothetical protein